ncbi:MULTISPECIES: hypothetical protein [Pirellulaceae]|uniref:Cbb3-type cytochrome oxidase component FixQ n=2 Tax=Stieleria TaxID=2795973 RepID=A0A518HPH0_9BACT|nr:MULTISPECIES: hypothetical protein [Pirellulaceae]MDV6029813.1 hypothetical protein [Phycisphaera sp. RhM]QDV83557.1 hypothetical protein TBK1r_24990 [Planctomycetes bacterium TBK1r]MCS7466036.1 hypothetical protein [Stieleria sedimenti]PAY18308.1 hypothetical protein CKO51_16975 [Rhodopirellula sp. SM50]QDV42721.1 hypothetical protein Enr13x_25710 [Stieleria neptunia]
MIKDLVSFIDYSACAEVALALFVGTFFLIFFGAFRLSKNATEKFAAIPLSDRIEDPRSE